MNHHSLKWLCRSFALLAASSIQAAYQDDIGLYELRARDASLTGNGIVVGQIEAPLNTDNYQTDPANTGLSSSLFTYYDSNFPWSGGGGSFDSSRESGHANIVGSRFFGVATGTQNTDGVAPGVAAIEIFEAGHYYNDLVSFGTQTNAVVVNQSFVFLNLTETQADTVESDYDDYAANNSVLFVNGINNNGSIPPPASSYNGIAVNVAGDSASPLTDGRSKPDISAPGSTLTSYVTPLVSGAAAILIQSALNDDAGAGTSASASDIRTVKALILNGAAKPKGWVNTSARPLDIDYGSGVLEINQSHLQLIAGQYGPTQDEVLTEAGTSHLPHSGETGNVASNTGWNLGSVTNTAGQGNPATRKQYDVTDHYYFDLNSSDAAAFYLTSTLVWNRQSGRSSINNLDLFLYTDSGTLIASSVSSVDNVEHLYERHLAPGRYVLQVHKPYNDGRITDAETYALAFNFRPAPAPGVPTNVSATAVSASEIDLTWTDTSDDETGYRVERRPSGGTYSTIATLAANTEFYDDTGLTAATVYEYRITAFNATGDSASIETSGSTYSKIEDWRLTYFDTTANSGDAADGNDFDLDSIVNLIEFTTGSDPTTFSPNPLDTSLLGSDGQVSFQWRIDNGYNFSIGYSSDLKAGFTYYDSATLNSGSSPELELIGTSAPVDGFETRTYGVRGSITAPNVFLRLRVE